MPVNKETKYRHVFIDLDRTLWDFPSNSFEVMQDLFAHFLSEQRFVNFTNFFDLYERNNERLWQRYRDKLISKDKLWWYRFYTTLQQVGIENEFLAKQMGDFYVERSKTKTHLYPYTHELLSYLKRKYRLYIITNGFEEVQHAKIANCQLDSYFTHVFTSEKLGVQKPNPAIFHYALAHAGARAEESIMIGDDIEADIRGAAEVGLDQIFLNHNGRKVHFEPSYEVSNLEAITHIL